MSKKARGTNRRQPTQRRPPNQRPQGRGGRPDARQAATTAPSQLDAAARIADDVADDRPATAAGELRGVARSTPARARARTSSLLATQAASEYVYVAQDLRRIVGVALLLFGAMLVLWLLIVVLGIIRI